MEEGGIDGTTTGTGGGIGGGIVGGIGGGIGGGNGEVKLKTNEFKEYKYNRSRIQYVIDTYT